MHYKIPKNIPLTWSIDQAFPQDVVFINRLVRLAHSDTPEYYAPCAINFLNISTFTADFPLNPFFNFEPRDYYRFRFMSDTPLLKEAADCMGAPADETLELRTQRVRQGAVPNFSKLIKFWTQQEPVAKTLSRFNIDFNSLKRFKLHTNNPVDTLSSLLQNPRFLRFLALGTSEINYLSIFPHTVLNMLTGLLAKKNFSPMDQDSLALIRYYSEQATLVSDDPLKFTQFILLIFEEIKLLLADSKYVLSDFQRALVKIFPDCDAYYANSGSDALSIILSALSKQKKSKLSILNIGCKYYEESISLRYTGHELIKIPYEDFLLLEGIKSLGTQKIKIDVLRMDSKSPANCQKKYNNVDISTIVDLLMKYDLCSEHFSLVVDGTLNSLSDSYIHRLKTEFKNKCPQGNFVYFGSGVKSHSLGIDIATFGWITVNNPTSSFSEFNQHLHNHSVVNAADNPDFQYVTHLLLTCTPQIIQYHEQLLCNTKRVYLAVKDSVDVAIYDDNNVPYLEIFNPMPISEVSDQLSATLLRFRGSFGFPYPTWINITNQTERSSIRISCGLLTHEQTQVLITILESTFGSDNLLANGPL